ncbi:BACON domain-containing protein [Bacteroides pyogenes]|uniref:BACON domain-containing protein n=1 Tax=Bacteroides pyogenes TaxID=310300 RepID=UPI003B43A08F
MKLVKYRTALLGFSLFALWGMSLLLQSCKDDEKAEKWVDLRYRVEDAYLLEAKNPEPVSFLVKSTDPWEVFGKYDWYAISPAKGEAGETYTVTITCKENTELDDRTDTISIKSDYWTGKRFVLTQKGIAYLDVEGVEMIGREGEEMAFDVLSNQKWTAKVTEGAVWLKLRSGMSGEQNGKVVVSASPNTGEQRTGVVTIYDRHGKVAREVACTQDGVLLTPATPENGKWFAVYEKAQQLVIPVESNAEWSASKENEADDDWYEFEKTSFSGSANLVINVSEHKGSSVRTGIIVLTTKADEGATPLVKTVKFKQANPKIPVVKEVNRTISGDFYGPGGLMPGRYNFYLEPFGNTRVNLFFIWSGSNPYAELRFHVLNKKTSLSTTPWCGDVFSENSNCIRDVDTGKPNVLSFDIQKAVDPNDPSKAWIYTEWILNDVVIAKATSDGITDSNGSSDTWKVPFDQISAGGTFLLRASGGSVVFTKWEYIAPLVWGD